MRKPTTAEVFGQAGTVPRGEVRLVKRGARRDAIAKTAASVFIAGGFVETSVDQIAAAAQVSKQTVYDYFGSKEQLFLEVMTAAEQAVLNQMGDQLGAEIAASDDLERDLVRLARRYLQAVLDPDVMALRRLVIGEVRRFPQLGRVWYEQGPGWLNNRLAERFAELGRAGKLWVEDPLTTAHHFSWLLLGMPQNMVLFGYVERFSDADLDRFARRAVQAFLAAYGTSPRAAGQRRRPAEQSHAR